MIRGRLRGRSGGEEGRDAGDQVVEIDPAELTGLFAVPQWLRDAGLMAWLLVGITVLLAGTVWLMSLTQAITVPVITATVIAAVAAPVVAWLPRHRVPRAVGAALVLLAIVALAVLTFVLIVGGIASQSGALSGHLNSAADTIEGWLRDLGVSSDDAASAKQDGTSAVTTSVKALLDGLGTGIEKLSSLAFFLSLTALSLFFLLKDGPVIRRWGERHLGVPDRLARSITTRMLQSLRGYFTGVTVVAAFNAVVIGLAALIVGVPLAGTIALVTFLAAYIPYLGAWAAGAFAVLIALGSEGTDAALTMAVVALLANGVLQQLVQPFAYGAALNIHPLAVLVVTIAGGSLFGAPGLILAAPVTAAIARISADVRRGRAEEERVQTAAPAAPGPHESTATAGA